LKLWCVVAAVLVALPAAAALICSEGFDYEVGSELHEQNGGVGWAEPWTNVTFGIRVTNVVGLTYPGWITQGDAAAWACRSAQMIRKHPNLPGNDGDVVWFSLLFHITNPSASRVHFAGTGGSTTGFGIELVSTGGGGVQARIGGNVGATAPAALMQTHLVIGKFVFSNDTPDHLDVWVNPASWITELALGPADTVREAAGSFGSVVYVRTTDTTPMVNAYVCDELRLGETLMDVTLIPEPAAVGAVALLMAIYARKR